LSIIGSSLLRKPPDNDSRSRSNARQPAPYIYSSADSDDVDVEPITPYHLLHGRLIVSLPHLDTQDDNPTYGETDLKRSAKTQALLLPHFWHRWKMHYLTTLREFHQNTGCNTQTVKVGDNVLSHDDTPRVQRKLAVVEEVNKRTDGLICSVHVRTATGKTNWPIAK